MNTGKYVFSQVMSCITQYEFNQCVLRYQRNYGPRSFSHWEQFSALTFGQLTYRDSLRDIVVCLKTQQDRLYHFGFRSPLVLSTIARANERRDWRIWSDLANVLIERARKLYVDDNTFTLDLVGAVYLIDSTTIDLCLSVFPWAHFRTTKSAVKVHTQLDARGNIPIFFDISSGKVHDVHFLDTITYDMGAHYVMDRGYTDFERLHTIHVADAFFVIRAKKNLVFRRVYSNAVDKTGGLRCDQVIHLTGTNAVLEYPNQLRRIKYYDDETERYYVFLTNDLTTDALTIAALYKYRWQIELFFKWIKQHLKIKRFWGQSENAVKTQVCTAVCSYLIVAILKKQLHIDRSLYEMLQILSITPFLKMPLSQLFSENQTHIFDDQSSKQLNLLDF